MKTGSIVIGSAIMALLVVSAHSFIQFIVTKNLPVLFEWKKILLFLLVFISCIGLTKQEGMEK